MKPRILVSCLALLFAGSVGLAQEAVSFHRQIRPILQQKCQGCHQPAKKSGGLLLISYEDALKGGDAGPMWKAGDPAQSLVVKYLKGLDNLAQMPEGEPPLPAPQIALFESWIKQGAKDDTPDQFKKT
ncbi:MAG: c-type cytochrome domain-containing protein, partial [Gemmataceae bacterium]